MKRLSHTNIKDWVHEKVHDRLSHTNINNDSSQTNQTFLVFKLDGTAQELHCLLRGNQHVCMRARVCKCVVSDVFGE